MKRIILLSALILTAPHAYSQNPEDALKDKFMNRSGAFSEDRRSDDHDLASVLGPGPRTGCHGDTVSTGVTITGVNVTINGDVADVFATYSGKYTRQGWMKPCVQTPGGSGHEDRNVSGKAHFTIKQRPWANAEFAWIGVSDFGEVNDPNHDSNVTATNAVKNAIASGM
ncbi:hypothetical protein [Pseudomonas sp. 460]|uniref:hypothetical protein n=1 Tax=Pseudomonas sp. 460 TaxID=2485142 RepID=UPI00104316AA|nr:hypothetical protein [Pseudomonas sp. 460]TCV51620.1 hypothetical protein EDB99_107286 [Pseudomonas sp. 460]